MLLLADAIVALHLGFVLFVVFGGLLVIRRTWVAWLHLPAAAWGAWIELSGWICPLTPLENTLRARAGGVTYTTTFVDRYLVSILYPASLTRQMQWALGAAVIVINAFLYAVAFRRSRRLS
jgi:hypothetical protein